MNEHDVKNITYNWTFQSCIISHNNFGVENLISRNFWKVQQAISIINIIVVFFIMESWSQIHIATWISFEYCIPINRRRGEHSFII